MLKKVVIGVGVAEPRYGGPKSLLTEKMALVGTDPPHFIQGGHQRSACHFAVLVDNDV
jgi:hypothetical protein